MYRYLERDVAELDPPAAFLIAAMRVWVGAATRARCPRAALRPLFDRHGVADVLPDFGIVMAALATDGLANLHFAPDGWKIVRDDEAILLGLFDAAVSPDPAAVYRIAAALVADDAVNYLARAAKLVAASLACGTTLRAGERP
ncbi:hypothetical protein [Sphingomonas sp. Leaf357]|uniref:hypothetical protein n=1 Tax=Sphingomonas sp. Leaf357 TaxID=1736350 RepID=UPI000B29CA6B|nr:hypothetical protein [Sphingomonas sp. Leaf357]